MDSSIKYGYTMGRHYPNESEFKVRIPEFMPLVPDGQPTQTPDFISVQFANDPACRPQPSSMIQTQNYVTVKRSAQCDLSHLGKWVYSNTRLGVSMYKNLIYSATIVSAD